MHENGYFHRDLKPENILITQEQVKICDFGSIKQVNCKPPFTEYTSTRWYRSPEQLLTEGHYNAPVDVFAIGVIMAELYNLKPIFQGANQHEQLKLIQTLLAKDHPNQTILLQPNNITPQLRNIIPVSYQYLSPLVQRLSISSTPFCKSTLISDPHLKSYCNTNILKNSQKLTKLFLPNPNLE
jgi:serine/threonine protein kinase